MACIPCLENEKPQHFYTDVFTDERGIFYPSQLTEGEGVLNKKWPFTSSWDFEHDINLL